MLYYRYRPGTPLSIKELIYNEIYFSSVSECNDPYEGQMFAEFIENHDYWEQLVKMALKNSYVYNPSTIISSSLAESLVDCCVKLSPIDVNKFRSLNYDSFRIEVYVDEIIPNNRLDIPPLYEAIDRIKHYVDIHLPAEQYLVSFSRSRDNILMWSHYANNHRGYCLIFRPIGTKIMQDKRWMKKRFKFDTPQSRLANGAITFIIDEGFELNDVEYTTEKIPPINAFSLFPHVIDPEKFRKEVADTMKVAHNSYLRKHHAWKYEEETRLLLFKGVPQDLANRTITLSPHQRLFHYDPSQLVGIILGAKMPSEQRKHIQEIVKQKVAILKSESKNDKQSSDFVIFKARLSTDKIKIDTEPVEIYTAEGLFNKTQNKFERLFDNWKVQNQWNSNNLNKEEKIIDRPT